MSKITLEEKKIERNRERWEKVKGEERMRIIAKVHKTHSHEEEKKGRNINKR